MIDLPALHAAADENLAIHAAWATAQLPGARVRRDAQLVVVDSGLPCDTLNLVCRVRLSTADARQRAREVNDIFQATARPYSWWLTPGFTPSELPAILMQLGVVEAESEIAMAADLTILPQAPASVSFLEIARVRTRSELAAFAQVTASNWEPPDPHVLRYYEATAGALLRSDAPQRLYLGRVNRDAVATAEATVGGGVVGLYNISTRPAYRRRGIALAMVRAALAEAVAAGCSTAVLQASTAGAGVYGQLGFRSIGVVTEFKPVSPRTS